jgi:hypothetical protein
MAASLGPNLNKNVLVFAYDVGDVKNSFIGAPTENRYFTVSNQPDPWTVSGTNTDVSNTAEAGPIADSKTWKFVKSGASSQWNGWESTYNSVWTGSSGDIWTTSYWYKTVAAAGITNFGVGGFYLPDWSRAYNATILADRSTIIADGTWRYNYTTTRIDEAYTNAIIVDGPSWGYSTSAGVLYINGLQWEKKSYPTSFTNGTRTSTQGLLNLSNNSNTINLTNAGFDSSGNLYFNGSSNYIPVNQTLSVPITISGYVKYIDQAKTLNTFINGQPHPTLAISLNRNGAGNLQVFIGNGSAWLGTPSINSSSTISANTWYNITFTCDGTTSILYLNGVNVGSSSNIPSGFGSYFYIGHLTDNASNSEYFKGYINITQVYSAALSAAEVLDNYNSTKSRFGL